MRKPRIETYILCMYAYFVAPQATETVHRVSEEVTHGSMTLVHWTNRFELKGHKSDVSCFQCQCGAPCCDAVLLRSLALLCMRMHITLLSVVHWSNRFVTESAKLIGFE